MTGDPEKLQLGEAKEILAQWIATAGRPDDAAALRRTIALTCALDVVAARCPAFGRFLEDIEAALGR